MKPTVLCTLLLVCCSSLTSLAGGHCYSDGPGHCPFQTSINNGVYNTFCDWLSDSNFYVYHSLSDDTNRFAGLIRGQYEGALESRTSCSTQNNTHCLHFEYNLVFKMLVTLSVSISSTGSDETGKLVWNMSSSNGWESARLPIKTDSSFKVVFEVKEIHVPTFRWRSYLVFVDNIFYSKLPCILHPPEASQSPVTATETTIHATSQTSISEHVTPTHGSESTERLENMSTSQESEDAGLTENNAASIISSTAVQDSSRSSSTDDMITNVEEIIGDGMILDRAFGRKSTRNAVTVSTVSSTSGCPCPLLSNQTGLIVGLIVAAVVIVIVVVIAVLLVQLKRKQFQMCKSLCCISKQQKEQFQMNASHNVAYILDAETNNSDNHRLDTRASSDSPSNCRIPRSSDNLPTSHNHSVPGHVDTGKTRTQNVEQKTSSKSQGNPHATTHKASDKAKMHSSKCPGTGSKNRASAAKGQVQDGGDLSPAPASRPTGDYELADPLETNRVYHILEKDPEMESSSVYHVPEDDATTMGRAQDGVYNSLDFDQKDAVDGKTGDEGKSEEATGGVYNHLNEGDGDTYNEVHMEKRVEVIYGVYSHIK